MKIRLMRNAAWALACLLLAACGALSSRQVDLKSAHAAQKDRHVDLQAEVDSLARPLVAEGHTPGIVIGVLLPDGRKHFFTYGVIDQESGRQPDQHTLFAVGSVSKVFLGAITSTLVAQGVLSWNDTLAGLMPRNAKLSADAKKITVLELVTHTSGLPRQPMTFQMFRHLVQYLFTGENLYRHLDDDQVLGYLAQFEAPSSKRPQYSNIGYAVLAYILEQRTGQSLEGLLEERLLRPLALENTGYTVETLPGYSMRAHGHAGDQPKFIPRGTPLAEWRFTHLMNATGGLYSSAEDLLTYAAAHFARETKLNTALVDTLRAHIPQPREAPGIAWMIDDMEGHHIAYHTGMVAGFSSYLGLDVQRRTAVVVLQNSFNWNDKVGHSLLIRLGRAPKLLEATGNPHGQSVRNDHPR